MKLSGRNGFAPTSPPPSSHIFKTGHGEVCWPKLNVPSQHLLGVTEPEQRGSSVRMSVRRRRVGTYDLPGDVCWPTFNIQLLIKTLIIHFTTVLVLKNAFFAKKYILRECYFQSQKGSTVRKQCSSVKKILIDVLRVKFVY